MNDIRVQVRLAEREDVAVILNFWSVARSPLATTDDDPSAIENLLSQRSSAIFIAHLEGLIVGTAIVAWDGWRGHIYRLAVLPEYRRRGIGRRLVSCGHERLRKLGARRVDVAVDESYSGSATFWLAVGYERDLKISRHAKTL